MNAVVITVRDAGTGELISQVWDGLMNESNLTRLLNEADKLSDASVEGRS